MIVRCSPDKNSRGSMLGLFQTALVILAIIGMAYYLLNVVNKRSASGSGNSALEGIRQNVESINAKTKAREEHIGTILRDNN